VIKLGIRNLRKKERKKERRKKKEIQKERKKDRFFLGGKSDNYSNHPGKKERIVLGVPTKSAISVVRSLYNSGNAIHEQGRKYNVTDTPIFVENKLRKKYPKFCQASFAQECDL